MAHGNGIDERDSYVHRELIGLARGLSHDLRGPLRSAQAALSMVESDLNEGDLISAEDTVVVVRAQLEALTVLATSVVEYCKGAFATSPVVEVSLRRWLGDLAAQARGAGRPNVTVSAPARVICIEQQAAARALSALVDNACIHHPRGDAGQVSVVGTVREGVLEVCVQDDGCGIAEAMQEAVFDHCRRAHTGRSGAGLGLTLARTLARRHGGDVQLTSAIQEGTEVKLTWPLAEDTAAESRLTSLDASDVP